MSYSSFASEQHEPQFDDHDYNRKQKDYSFYQQAKVRLSILTNQRWFRAVGPLVLATVWLIWGIRQQWRAVELIKVQNEFVTEIPQNITHWCYLNKAGAGKMLRSSRHTPYAVEWLAGCWAWLEAHNQTGISTWDDHNSTNGSMPAIGFDEAMYRQFLVRPLFPGWNRGFFRSIGVPILLQAEPPTEKPVFFSKPYGKATWFGNMKSCQSLRERLWHSLGINPPKVTFAAQKKQPQILSEIVESNEVSAMPPPIEPLPRVIPKLHIGLVERPSRRLIVDSEIIASELQQQFPNATVSYRTIDDEMTLEDQAGWFAFQDIVIMAHGAGVTNLIFMRPDTQLLELFPKQYFARTYQPLAEQCGIHHDWFCDGGSSPEHDNPDLKGRLWLGERNIHITIDQLRTRVQQMIVNLKQY